MKARPGSRERRRGAAAVEFALIAPILILLILGTLIVGLGLFRSQQVVSLAREGARWAAVRGPTYQQERGASAPTSQDLLEQVVRPRGVGLDPDRLSCTLTMAEGRATVTVRYHWIPEAIARPMTFESTAVAPITY